MALTVNNLGGGRNNSAATSQDIVPGSNFTAGAMAVLILGYDNTGGGDPYSSITDTIGNTWTSRVNGIDSPGGSSNDGVVLRIFTCDQSVGNVTTGTTITVSFSQSVPGKTWLLTEVVGSVGSPSYVAGNSNHTGTASSPAITTDSITSGDAVIGCIAIETLGITITPDSDTTNGSWSTIQEYNTDILVVVANQNKVVTGTATQTYNLSLSSSTDREIGWISVTEVLASAQDPFGQFGFFGI